MAGTTFQLTTLVLPSNLVDAWKLDEASAFISFRAPGSDKVHSAITSNYVASQLMRGKCVIVHHTPDTLDLELSDRAMRRANILGVDQINRKVVHVHRNGKWRRVDNLNEVMA